MATMVLQYAGSAMGGLIGGPIGAMLGRAAGALAGSLIDQKLFGAQGPRRKRPAPRRPARDVVERRRSHPGDVGQGEAFRAGPVGDRP